jgi:hypothetical protein
MEGRDREENGRIDAVAWSSVLIYNTSIVQFCVATTYTIERGQHAITSLFVYIQSIGIYQWQYLSCYTCIRYGIFYDVAT